jgi:hypothetical protein
MKLAKVLKYKRYLLPSGNLARVMTIDESSNRVIVYNYHSRQNEIIEHSLAPHILEPVFKISEVAKMLGKKPDTLRRYERLGKISPARQYRLGKRNSMRIYTERDIEALAEFFGEQVVGRPSSCAKVSLPVSRQEMFRMYKTRFTR